MQLAKLSPLASFTIAADTVLHRVQRATTIATTVARGPLKLPPGGGLAFRFDTMVPVAYLAEDPMTALYEARFRRDSGAKASITVLQASELIEVQLKNPIEVLDLLPHATDWPVLQAERYSETQQLAADALSAGYAGIRYLSAQHYGRVCYVLFDPAAKDFRKLSSTPLANSGGNLHRLSAKAVAGSCVPLVP